MRAKIELLEHVQGEYILVNDIGHNQGRSVTNDAEYIIALLYSDYNINNTTRIFYKDSQGQIDEIHHCGRKFCGFSRGDKGFTMLGGVK
ncbi:MAG: hypothetical protein FWC64_06930 [Treponema sp.]|nr:hypothetical protein [Treponema sp.]